MSVTGESAIEEGFHVFDIPSQGAIFVVALVTGPLCIGVTMLRFLVLGRAGRKPASEDWLALASLLPFLAYVVYSLVLVIYVENGRREIFQMLEFDPNVWRQTMIAGYVVQIIFGPQQTLAKTSLLIFYHRVFSVNKTFNRLTWLVGAIQGAYCISWVLTAIFMCNPPNKVWEPLTPGTCLDLSVVLVGCETVNSLVDFVMVGMAVYIVRALHISSSSKWKLGILFGFGGLTGVLGFVRIGMAYGNVGSNDQVLVYMMLQMASGILCACLPIYRAAFADLPFIRSIRSAWSSRSGSASKDHSGHSGRHTIKTIGQITSNSDKLRANEEWMQLDENYNPSHVKTTTWVGKADKRGDSDGPSYPMQTVEFRQSVEHLTGDRV